MTELDLVEKELAAAKFPEDVFGTEPEQAYRRLAKAVHPDIWQHRGDPKLLEQANKVFQALERLWVRTQALLSGGTYGQRKIEPIIVKTKRETYYILNQVASDEISIWYTLSLISDCSTIDGIFRIAKDDSANDLLENEYDILKAIGKSPDLARLGPYIPSVSASFLYRMASTPRMRRANILSYKPGLYSLQQIQESYQNGIDPKDAAWMWRRILVALGIAHKENIVHSALVPPNILVQPEQHGIVLVNWSYGTNLDSPCLVAIPASYKEWYPASPKPSFGLDIILATRSIISVLGGDPLTGTLPAVVPRSLRAFFKGSLLVGPNQEIAKLLEEFDDLIGNIWGTRKFHQFVMPKKI